MTNSQPPTSSPSPESRTTRARLNAGVVAGPFFVLVSPAQTDRAERRRVRTGRPRCGIHVPLMPRDPGGLLPTPPAQPGTVATKEETQP